MKASVFVYQYCTNVDNTVSHLPCNVSRGKITAHTHTHRPRWADNNMSRFVAGATHVAATQTAQQHVDITSRQQLLRSVAVGEQPAYIAVNVGRVDVWISAAERLSHTITVHRPTTLTRISHLHQQRVFNMRHTVHTSIMR